MLQLDRVSLRQGARQCLQDISLELAAGEVLMLAGPNGAGKSSLLKLACGEWRPSAGQVCLEGRALDGWAAAARARRLAVLPQQSQLDFAFLAEEVVSLGRLPHTSGWRRDRQIAREAMALMGVSELALAPYTQLSGGERRRVQLARVLAQIWPDAEAPPQRALLLDEPTAGLDWAHQLELMQNLRRLAAQGLAVLVVLHDLNLALRYADRVGLLQRGALCALGPAQQVLQPQRIQQVFGVEVSLVAHPRDGRPAIIQ